MIIIMVKVIINTLGGFKKDNAINDSFNNIKLAREYNVDFVVCIGRSVIDICKTATILINEQMSPLDRPQDVHNYFAQFDQHQRIIYTQLNYDIRGVNDERKTNVTCNNCTN